MASLANRWLASIAVITTTGHFILGSNCNAEPQITFESIKQTQGSLPEWEQLNIQSSDRPSIIWEPVTTEEKEATDPDRLASPQKLPNDSEDSGQNSNQQDEDSPSLFRWPNGQLMSDDDQSHYRSAWSRGSMIQIGDTVYANIGMNALQRAPESWVELGISAIDDSWQWFKPSTKPEDCTQGNFVSTCADGLMQNQIRLWDSTAFTGEIVWTIHSLSGEGAPFNFSNGDNQYGDDDSGTRFGDGQSLGFRVAKNFGKTFGISVGGDRLFHLDKSTDLSKPLYIKATKIFRLKDTLEPPILSLTLGLMTDVYNPDTNIGNIQYPDWLLGGAYPSIFAEQFDGKNKSGSGRRFYPNVAGTSSAFVCAEQTSFVGKQATNKHKDCIKQVAVAPVGSIGFAPWPWFGIYANFTRNLNLGISLKPFKEVNWNISAELVAPIVGLNSRQDTSIKRNRCPDDWQSFSACRTRIGLWTQLSF